MTKYNIGVTNVSIESGVDQIDTVTMTFFVLPNDHTRVVDFNIANELLNAIYEGRVSLVLDND